MIHQYLFISLIFYFIQHLKKKKISFSQDEQKGSIGFEDAA